MKTTLILTFFFLTSCSTYLLHKETEEMLRMESVLNDSFTGIMIYDLDEDKAVFSHHAEKYFTPASTVKLFTFYAALNCLPDTLEALHYALKNDTLYFHGTGDPSFLNPVSGSDSLRLFLKNRTETLIYSPFKAPMPYHSGWAWEDYKYAYMPEMSSFPIYGNQLHVAADSNQKLSVTPAHFTLREDTTLLYNGLKLHREFHFNNFSYRVGHIDSLKSRSIPFITSDSLLVKLLSDTIGKPIFLNKNKHLRSSFNEQDSLVWNGVKVFSRDSLLDIMMKESDNFIAEQLLYMCAQHDTGNIDFKRRLLDSLQLHKQPRWVDASGLSRYNLFTPHSFIQLLRRLYKDLPEKKWLRLFSMGGVNGTLAHRFKSETPYLLGKTGTLSNNHSLVGFLRTKSGKTLCFAFMMNHFREKMSKVQFSMDSLLKNYYLNYK